MIGKKVCLLGDYAVGKTSLVRRFVYNLFDDRYISTIGVKVSRKTVMLARDDDVVELSIMLWDLAGSEEFDQVRASYVRGAAGGVLVCDMTRASTLDSLKSYAGDLLRVSPDAHLVLAANKCDLIERHQLTAVQIEAFASDLDIPHFSTSAKTGQDVEALFRHLGRMLAF